MNSGVRRIFAEKKKRFAVEARGLFADLHDNLGITGLKGVRAINRYDIEGMTDEEYRASCPVVFYEPTVDDIFEEYMDFGEDERVFACEYLPGQYDQRADSAAQCVQLLTCREKPVIRAAKLIVLKGDVTAAEFDRIKAYCINPVESREAAMDKPETLHEKYDAPGDIEILQGFKSLKENELDGLISGMGLAMSFDDLRFCRDYFRDTEHRDPTYTEIRVIDTYWSDHCRHTTFLTAIEDADIEDGRYTAPIREAYGMFLESHAAVYGKEGGRELCLMDMATMAMKEMRKNGKLDDMDASDEINACSIVVNALVDGREEEWLVMFKNETHNHPTEIEPFGGAATCLGGAIRDPLSGRSYVYQAMRVTGSGDPRAKISDTLPGKLPQRKITTGAASGYSSYGNQIGLATGQVAEIYDEGFVAKRMEIGAVIGAAPRRNVVRKKPVPGDAVILLGGRTGRDGCGGATGSSKEHDEKSILLCGSEVQKGNPPTERKIQRLFRNPAVSALVKKCNDFGAGGVSVAIGELAPGLEVDLDAVPKKYEGLDGTELAISESQERMAVVVDTAAADAFINAAADENLEAVVVAHVTGDRRLRMKWRGCVIVDITRDFLDTNGARQSAKAKVVQPSIEMCYFRKPSVKTADMVSQWLRNLGRLNVCSEKGLVERFDSTIGAGTVSMPFGGAYQTSPAEGMAAKLPVTGGDTTTCTAMTHGYNPAIAWWSPFHSAIFAIVEAVAKAAAMGCDCSRARLTLQEYFEKLGKDPVKWGKPFSALLGAYYAQMKLGIPAIGGKDSMSGSFRDMSVPPTLVAFAVAPSDVRHIISAEFKKSDSLVIMLPLERDKAEIPDFGQFLENCARVRRLACEGVPLSASTVREGGIAASISRMCFGNRIGFAFNGFVTGDIVFSPEYGSIILEIPGDSDHAGMFEGLKYRVLGRTCASPEIVVNGSVIPLADAQQVWENPLEQVFSTHPGIDANAHDEPDTLAAGEWPSDPAVEAAKPANDAARLTNCASKPVFNIAKPASGVAKPVVFMPVFPGTNCEYDTEKAFVKAGAKVDTLVLRNLSSKDIGQSVEHMVKMIDKASIIMLPGGFSGGDEPDGSGKFIAATFRNPYLKDAVMRLLKERDGLMLGICNGFQALIKLGLVPYGEIRDIDAACPTLTYNTIGRHVSRMVDTKVESALSPWLSLCKPGDMHVIPVSHGEGRFVASAGMLASLFACGQVATRYVDFDGRPSMDIMFNPNGSDMAIEGITSPDGRVFGKMGHSERAGTHVAVNIPGEKDQRIFEAGVAYFK